MAKLSRGQIVGGLLAVVVVIAVAGGLFLLGPPAEERGRRLDDRRVEDLSVIASAVDLYWTRREALPASLDELQKEPGGKLTIADPRTNERYEYRPLKTATYELCATFEADSREPARVIRDEFWSHGSGRQCFPREARKLR